MARSIREHNAASVELVPESSVLGCSTAAIARGQMWMCSFSTDYFRDQMIRRAPGLAQAFNCMLLCPLKGTTRVYRVLGFRVLGT